MTQHMETPGTGTLDTERSAHGSDGWTGSHGRSRRRQWMLALALVGLGAIGGTLATVSMDAGAHGGWRHAMGEFRHHGRGHATSPERAIERLQHASAWALGSVDATDEQRERIDAILASTVEDIFPIRSEYKTHRRDLIAELARPEVDRTALERVRTAMLAQADKTTTRMLDSVIAIAEVLDPEQRQQLVKRLSGRWH